MQLFIVSLDDFSYQELSESLSPVQLIVEEVNDQAARLADSGVPLSHTNLSKLDDLNSRYVIERVIFPYYFMIAGRFKFPTPLVSHFLH